MVTRDTAWGDGTPCWVDLGVTDIAKASAFYAELFGWEAQPGPPEAGGYTVCRKDGRQVAGIGPNMGPPGSRRRGPPTSPPATRPGPPGGSRRPVASC